MGGSDDDVVIVKHSESRLVIQPAPGQLGIEKTQVKVTGRSPVSPLNVRQAQVLAVEQAGGTLVVTKSATTLVVGCTQGPPGPPGADGVGQQEVFIQDTVPVGVTNPAILIRTGQYADPDLVELWANVP